MNYYNCPICGGSHKIDKYDWIQSCIGYFWKEEIKMKEKKYLETGHAE